jgi:uncharacterized protein with PIN domain
MPYIKTESDRVIAWVDDDYKDFDSLEEYINDCDLCERPLEPVEKCDGYMFQFPEADKVVNDFIEDLYQDGIAPEDWDEIDIKNHLTDLDWFKEEYDKLVNEFNRRQKVECWQSNGIYIYPEYFNHELYGNNYLDESFKENEHEICNVIKRINERTINQVKEEIKRSFIENEDITKLSKEQKEKIKESVKNYFKEHSDLEIPTNEESGLPFWEDDFMMTHSED